MLVDNLDLDILKLLSTREGYDKYVDLIKKPMCTKESWSLITDFGRYYKEYPQATEIDSGFKMWMQVTGHPLWKPEEHEVYGRIIENVKKRNDVNSTDAFINELNKIENVQKLKRAVKSYESGQVTNTEFLTGVSALLDRGSEIRFLSPIQTYDLEALAQYQRDNKGFYWRLEDLNRSIGPVRKGDVVIVAKRPEVGGTSFLVSEMAFMLEQSGAPNAVIFNNEEAPDKVYTRMVSSALGIDHRTMMSSPKTSQINYKTWLKGKEWDLIHDTTMTIQSIHKQLRTKEYGLIGINVLLKVGGTEAREDHDKLQALGEELRRIAQQYGPVVAIVQADPSAEGLRFIPQDRIYKSKTALQGEADALIMIGKDETSPDTSRFIHVAKNKIPPAPCTELSNKHIKTEVNFDISTGRYTSLNYKGNSRYAASNNN